MNKLILSLLLALPLFAVTVPKQMTIDTGFLKPNSELIKSVIQEMMKRNNITLKYRTLPNLRSLKSANSGLSDGEAARIWDINKMFPNLVRVPEYIYDLEIIAVSKNKELNIKKLADLKPLRVGVIKGMKIAEVQVSAVNPKQYITANSAKLLLGMLEKGRLDVAIINKLGVYGLVHRAQLKGIYLYKSPLIHTKLYFHLHSKNQELVPMFLKTLKQMKKDGSFKKLNSDFLKSLHAKTKNLVTVVD